MKKILILCLAICFSAAAVGTCLAAEKATVAECVAKSKLAAKMLL